LDFCSLKVILLSFAQFDILLISMFALLLECWVVTGVVVVCC
jgi:hypothetical protein